MDEALERLLPHCNGSPHKVASRLNDQHREGDVCLLAGDIAMDPGSNPSMLGIVAHIPPDGRAFLYVQVRSGRPAGPVWDGRTSESLAEHHRVWAFDRATFDEHFPVPVDRGGRPPKYDRDSILVEAAVAIYEVGLPSPLTIQGWTDMIGGRLGDKSPGDTLLKEILGPLHKRIKAIERKR
jgi:hypothetical protein